MIRKLFASTLAVLGLVGLIQIAAAQVPVGSCAPCPCPEACPEKVCHRVTDNEDGHGAQVRRRVRGLLPVEVLVLLRHAQRQLLLLRRRQLPAKLAPRSI